MPAPEPLSPLQNKCGDAFRLSLPGLHVEERPFLRKLSVRGRTGDGRFRSAFAEIYGIEPPLPGRAAETASFLILPVGPTEWLVTDDSSSLPAPSLRAVRLRIVDVSSASTVIRLAGSNATEVLRRLAALPLESLPAGSVARTRIGRLAVVVHARRRDCVDLFVPRSYAKSFVGQLSDAAEIAA